MKRMGKNWRMSFKVWISNFMLLLTNYCPKDESDYTYFSSCYHEIFHFSIIISQLYSLNLFTFRSSFNAPVNFFLQTCLHFFIIALHFKFILHLPWCSGVLKESSVWGQVDVKDIWKQSFFVGRTCLWLVSTLFTPLSWSDN